MQTIETKIIIHTELIMLMLEIVIENRSYLNTNKSILKVLLNVYQKYAF